MTKDSAGSRSGKTPVAATVFSTDTLIGYEEAKAVTDVGPTMKRLDVGDQVMLTWIAQGRRTRQIPPRGVVLVILLLIITAIAVLSADCLWRSDVELACGRNMLLRIQMDALAESGLEHARGLLLNPQDIPQEYWGGDLGQQLAARSSDFYDVNVVKLGECNYRIVSSAYRLQNSEKIGRTILKAELRFDPCLAYWQGNDAVIPWQAQVAGDVYCRGKLTVDGTVDGDAFADETIRVSGAVRGHRNELTASGPIALPGLSPTDYDSRYYSGSGVHGVHVINTQVLRDVQLGPTPMNPAGIYCRRGVLHLKGHIKICGMLVATQDLILEDQCEVVIEAVKNFPALLVGNDVKMSGPGQHLQIEGLAQIGRSINMGHGAGNTIEITGALCLVAGGVEETAGCVLTIKAAPNKAAILVWRSPQTPQRWSPAAGAFFKSIQRL
jgi:hypothetical protein